MLRVVHQCLLQWQISPFRGEWQKRLIDPNHGNRCQKLVLQRRNWGNAAVRASDGPLQDDGWVACTEIRHPQELLDSALSLAGATS